MIMIVYVVNDDDGFWWSWLLMVGIVYVNIGGDGLCCQ